MYSSLSSSSSSSRKFRDGFDGFSVSDEGDGDNPLRDFHIPRECDCCVSVTSGESVRYLSVVDGSFAMVLLSVLMLTEEGVRERGFFRRDRFIMTTPSSDEESFSWYLAQGLWLQSSSSSSASLHSTAIHCSTLSSKRICRFSP